MCVIFKTKHHINVLPNLFHFNRIKIDVCIHDNTFDILHSNGELLLSRSNGAEKKIEYNLSCTEYAER